MRSIKKMAVLIGLGLILQPQVWGQVENRSTAHSNAGAEGGTSGNFQHFGVAGEVIVGSPFTGGAIESHIGFLYAVDDDLGNIPCPIPDGLDVTALADVSASVSWNFVGGNTYNYQYRVEGSSTWTTVNDHGMGDVDLTGLTPGTLYEFQVQANCGPNGLSEFTESILFETFGPPACEEPFNVSLAVDGQSVAVNWDEPPGSPSGYIVEYRLDDPDEEWVTTNVVINGTSADITLLAEGTAYQLRVGSQCPDSDLFAAPLIFVTDGPPPCPAPDQLTADNIGSDGFTLNWSGSGVEYDARIRPMGEFNWTEISGISGTSQGFTGLLAGVTYEAQVRADCGGSISEYSQSLEVTTDGEPCEVPIDLVLDNVTETTASISWTHAGALFYDLRYKVSGTASWLTAQSVTTSFELSNLIGGLSYVVQVRATCAFDIPATVHTEEFEFTTAPSVTPCDMPTNLQADVVDQDATLSWDETNGTAAAFEVRYRQVNAVSWITRLQISNSLALTGLTAGGSYEFQVRSLCGPTGEIQSEFTELFVFDIPAAFECTTPDNIMASAGIDDSEMVISWDNITEATGYIVRYRIAGTPFWSSSFVANPGGGTAQETVNVELGTDYQYEVATVCSPDFTVQSDFSATANFTSGGAPTCMTPLTVAAVPDETTALVSWSDEGADSYILRYRQDGTIFWITLDGLGTVTQEELLAGLTPATTYDFQVASVCGTLQTTFTPVAEFTTTGSINCDEPVMAAASNITQTSMTINWTGPDEANSYTLEVRPTGSVLWNPIHGITNTFFDVEGLFRGTAYDFRVQSVCDDGLTSDFTPVSTFETLGDPSCDLPTNILADVPVVPVSVIDPVVISWTAFAEAQFYQVRYRLKGTATWSFTVSNGIDDQVELGTLADGAIYEYQVRSVCQDSPFFACEYSLIEEFATAGEPCLAPVVTLIDVTGENTADITWGEVSSASGGYEYRYRPQGAVMWTVDNTTTDPTDATASLTGLFAGTTYQFRVRSLCGDGVSSELSDIETFTTPGVFLCAIPDQLGVIDTDESSAELTWSGDADRYDIQYRSFGAFEWTTIIDVTDQDGIADGVQYTIEGLAADDVYDWRVRSICSPSPDRSIRSDYSTLSSFATTSAPAIPNVAQRSANPEIETSADEEPSSDVITESLAQLEMTAYPNPFIDFINIRLFNQTDASIRMEVYDLTGVLVGQVYDGLIMGNQDYEFEFDGSRLGNGVYLLVISGLDDQSITERIVIQR